MISSSYYEFEVVLPYIFLAESTLTQANFRFTSGFVFFVFFSPLVRGSRLYYCGDVDMIDGGRH